MKKWIKTWSEALTQEQANNGHWVVTVEVQVYGRPVYIMGVYASEKEADSDILDDFNDSNASIRYQILRGRYSHKSLVYSTEKISPGDLDQAKRLIKIARRSKDKEGLVMLLDAGLKLNQGFDTFEEVKEFFGGWFSWAPGGEEEEERRFKRYGIRKKLF